MALTTKSVNSLTHFNQDYYNSLKRNVSTKKAEEYRLKVTKQRPKAIDLGQPGAFKRLSENQIRGYEEQNEVAKKEQKQIAEDVATGKVMNLGTDPKEANKTTDPEADQKAKDLAQAQQAEANFLAQQEDQEGDIDPTHDQVGTQDQTQEDLGQSGGDVDPVGEGEALSDEDQKKTDAEDKDGKESDDTIQLPNEIIEDNDPDIEDESKPQVTAEDLGEAPDEKELQGTVDNPIDLGAGDPVAVETENEAEDEAEELTRDEVLKLLRANGFKVPGNIKYETAVKKAVDAGLL